jgi:arsenate reductase
MIQVYHNQRCGKSRNCLIYLKDSNVGFEIITYLDNPPSFEELKTLLQKLGLTPLELVRQKEKIWMENFKGKSLKDDEIILAMVEHPVLIERPIIIRDDKAIVARELEKIELFLKTLTNF